MGLLVAASVVAAASAAASAAGNTPSPKTVVAQAQKEWLSELDASARTGDRSASFPSPSRAVLIRRLRQAQERYGFQIISVKLLHPARARQ